MTNAPPFTVAPAWPCSLAKRRRSASRRGVTTRWGVTMDGPPSDSDDQTHPIMQITLLSMPLGSNMAHEGMVHGQLDSRSAPLRRGRPLDAEGHGFLGAPDRGAGSASVGRIVVGMEGHQPQVVAFPVGDGADPPAQTDRVGLGSIGRLNVVDGLPVEAGVTVDALPVLGSEAPKRANALPEVEELEAEQRVLELGAVQIEENATTSRRHG